MKYRIILPVVDKETTDECLSTLAEPMKHNLLLVDNSVDKFTKDHEYKEINKYIPDGNIGVSRSWNIGARPVVRHKLDYLIILSATMRFHEGMNDFLAHLQNNIEKKGLESQHGWHCIAIGREVFEKIGYFDENYYPGYYEDSDFIRRMELAGIHNPMSTTIRIPKVDIQAGFAGNAHAMRKASINVNMGACRQYFIDKWGYEPRYETQQQRDLLYKHPFNDPHNGLDYWPVNSIETLMKRYELLPKEEPEEEQPVDQPVEPEAEIVIEEKQPEIS